jgi:hypothetical protein
MAITVKEVFRGTTYTEGTISRRYDRARIVCYVSGLADTRDQLDQAVTSARTGRLVHPDNTALPLRYATARWARGGDDGSNAAAWVELIYDKTGSQQATDSTEFSVIADVNVRWVTVPWWGKDRSIPATPGTPDKNNVNLGAAPGGGNANVKRPYQKQIEVPVWDISVPVVLSSSPISSVAATVGKVNDASFTIGNKAFPAGELRFDGLSQRTTKIDDGSSVTYEFAVGYRYARMEGGWYSSKLVSDATDPELYAADAELMYESATFSAPPT